MALTVLHHQLIETMVDGFSTSIGASPVVAVMRAPFRGRVTKVGCVSGGTITTSNASVNFAINTGASFVNFNIAFATSTIGQVTTATPTGAISTTTVNEDDAIIVTPSNASGAAVPATFFAVIRKAGV